MSDTQTTSQTPRRAPVIAGRLQTFVPPASPIPELKTESTVGHTPGSTSYRFESKGQSFVFIGYLIRNVALQLAPWKWRSASTSIRNRRSRPATPSSRRWPRAVPGSPPRTCRSLASAMSAAKAGPSTGRR